MSAGKRLTVAIGVLALAGALVAAPTAGAKPAKRAKPTKHAKHAAKLKVRAIPKSGVVRLGTVRCVAREACVVRPRPKRVARKAAGKKVKARVVVPRFVGPRGKASVKLRFGAGARRRLAGHTATFRARVVVRGSGRKAVKRFKVRLRVPAAAPTNPGGGPAAGGKPAPSGEAPRSEPVSGEAPELARPLTAVTVGGVSLKWFPRSSWVRYVASGEGTVVGGGATSVGSEVSPCPAQPANREGSEAPPAGIAFPYEIDFAAAESWYDPASGQAAIKGTGSVAFRFQAHTINLTGSEPEIQINGASSQAVFRFSGSEGTPYPNQRVALLSLDTSGRPTTPDGGKTLEYGLMRGALTDDGEKVFAGFYPAPTNNGFGCVSASFTLP